MMSRSVMPRLLCSMSRCLVAFLSLLRYVCLVASGWLAGAGRGVRLSGGRGEAAKGGGSRAWPGIRVTPRPVEA